MKIEVTIPDGKRGDWKISTFKVSEADALIFNVRATFSFGNRGRYISPGTYKKLTRNGTTVMSNTDAEIVDHYTFFQKAEDADHILINGLGLGVTLTKILQYDKIKTITVIEISEDVINLVAPYFIHPKIKIIHADAFTWCPPKGKRYSTVWHDIWDNLCIDNMPDMYKLHRKYGKRCDWQESWSRLQCENLRTQGRRAL